MSEAAIAAHGLEKRFGAVTALRALDLEVTAGTTLGVIGPNGAGKSTLLRLLGGLSRPSAGTLRVGRDRGEDRRARRRRVGLVTHQTFLYAALTARENLILAGRLYGAPDPSGRADALLEEVDLAAAAGRPAGTLSRGMAQRLAIARALVHDPEIVLLDEPFAGLDPRASERLAGRLAKLRREGRTTVLVTHDLHRAAELADATLLLVRGRAFHLPRTATRKADALATAYADTVAQVEAAAR